MGNVARLRDLGCSVYHDGLSRSLIRSGRAARLIELGVTGVTSNPVIFHSAISSSDDYDEEIARGTAAGRSPDEVMWDLIVDDVQQTADLLDPVYRRTQRRDGYVSVEVHPALADDAEATLEAARELWRRVDRPNVMIKIPATEAGISCVEQLTADGVNLNITVVPAVATFEAAYRAHARGQRRRLAAGLAADVTAVASLFLARIDTVVDEALDEFGDALLSGALRGRAGLAIAKLAYQRYLEMQSDPEDQVLRRGGAMPLRLLWASTGPKDPRYPTLLYVEGLVGPQTIITLPPPILEAFEERGTVRDGTLTEGVAQATADWDRLCELGFGTERVVRGVQAIVLPLFADAMRQLEALVADRCATAGSRL